jgi:hypothetical protein
MNRRPTLSFSLATLSLAVLVPTLTLPASAQSKPAKSQASSQDSTAPSGDALHMVPARAALNGSLTASKVKAGDEFRATLAEKVQLSNGPKLPAGTILIGQISTDDMNQSGTSKLALRFTSAKLKNGQTIPIKATIVGILDTGLANEDTYRLNPNGQTPSSWNDGTLAIDQLGAMSGVDLHSKIASSNSGVFVSTKDNIKLVNGGELELAIAQQQHTTNDTTVTNGNQ